MKVTNNRKNNIRVCGILFKPGTNEVSEKEGKELMADEAFNSTVGSGVFTIEDKPKAKAEGGSKKDKPKAKTEGKPAQGDSQ
jgi:hypothetical protein